MKWLPEKVSYRAVVELVGVLAFVFAVVWTYFGSNRRIEEFKKRIIQDEKFMTQDGKLYLVYEAQVEKETKTLSIVAPTQIIEVVKERPVKGDERVKVVERTVERPVKGDEKVKVVERVVEKPITTAVPSIKDRDTSFLGFGVADTPDVRESLKRINAIKKYTLETVTAKEDGQLQAKQILALQRKLVFVAEVSNNLTEFKKGLPPTLPKLLVALIEDYQSTLNTNDGLLEFVEGIVAGCNKAMEKGREQR